jgi:hypothetical protein
MSDGDGGYYFDQQAADDAAYQQAQAPQAPAADINSLYQELLGRAPDPTGIAANTGASADTIRESILASPEYNNQNVNTIYQDLLGRAPDPTGIAANAGATPEQIRQSIFGSAEYQNQNQYQAPPSGFFDRPRLGAENADPYSIVGNMLMQGNQLVYNVAPIRDDSGNISGYNRADTGEYVDLNKLNKSITGYDKEITDLYENLLGRAPDVSEVIAYNQRLKSGEVDLSDVVKGFTTSQEYLDKKMPFLDPNADVNTQFEQGVRGFDAKGLTRGGALEGLPTHYFDPKTGKLAAWFGTNDGLTGTDFYTWHTADELKVPGSEMRLAEESRRDVGKDWRTLGTKAATIYASMAMPQLMAHLAPALTTGSALADAAIQSAVMQGGKAALSGGDIGDILKAAGIAAVTSAAGSVAGDYLGDLAGDYVGLSDAGANELMGDYTSSPTFNDYIDARSAGDSGDMVDSGEGAEYIEPATSKSRDSLGIETAPQETIDAMTRTQPDFQLVQGSEYPPLPLSENPLYGTPAMPLQQEQLADLTIPTADNYDMPMVDLTAGVPEQTLADQIITNPDVPISDVLSNLDIISLLSSGTSVEGVAEIIGAIGGGGGIGGGTGGGGGGIGGIGGIGGGVGGGGIASVLNSIINGGAEESTTEEDDETKKKKKQQQAAAVAAIEAIAARTPPGAQIDYLYDIGGESIFAPMRQQPTKPRQDWAYEPNDRFAHGGMIAFDEGGDVTEEARALMHNPKLSQRGKARMEREYPEDPSMVGEIAAGFHPVIGPALSVKDFKEAAGEDDYLGMGLAALGMIPIAGGAIKGYNRLVKPALRERAFEKDLVKNYGKIPKGKPIPEGYIGGPDAPIPRFPNAESQAGYYAQPKFQTDYGREFTHDLVHSSPSPNITSFDPTSAVDTRGNRFATLNPDKARGASGNPLMAGGHASDDITTFLSNSPHYSQQYLPSNFDIPAGFPMVQGMPIPKETYKPGATMYPVSARLGNVYDPTMPEAGKIANSFLDSLTPPKGMSDKEFNSYKKQFSQGLRNGEWQAIESAPFRSFLKEQGFDSFAYLKGSGKDQVKNYGVFEPNRVRGKYAEFNPAAAHESDIMKANGGIIDLLRSK